MWSNPFKKLRQKRAARASVPAPEARILGEYSLPSQSAYLSTTSNPYSDYTSYSFYTASSSASPPYSMAIPSSTASPGYSASLQQASSYYAASSYVPSPLGSGLSYTPSPPPQLSYAYSPAQWPLSSAPLSAPLYQELGIAPSRADEVFIARQYEATVRRIARAVPDGLTRAGRGRHDQEDDTGVGAAIFSVSEDHLIIMRQALSDVPMRTVPIASINEPTVKDMQEAMLYTFADPPQAPKDIIPVLSKIEEAREPSDEESEKRSEDEFDTAFADKYGGILSTTDRDTTPELSSGSGSPASRDTFLSSPRSNGLGIEQGPPPSVKFDNSKWKTDWKLPVSIGTLDWLADLKGWEEETVNMLTRVGIDGPAKS